MDKKTVEEVKQRVKIKDVMPLEKSKHGEYICPFCGSGTGPKKSGAFHVYEDDNKFKCFVCGAHGDVIDMYAAATGEKFTDAVKQLARRAGVSVEEDPAAGNQEAKKTMKKGDVIPDSFFEEWEKRLDQEDQEEEQQEEKDFTPYYEKCRERLISAEGSAALEYLSKKRGIDYGIALDYYVGFDPKADPAKKGHPAPRLILPTSKDHYVARAISDDVPEQYQKMNPLNCSPGIFNIDVLKKQEVQEVFVCEGIFDALSFLTVGAPAVALCSTSNAGKFLDILEKDRPRKDLTFILALDNDKSGRDAGAKLSEGLRRLSISFTVADVNGGEKDANAALVKDAAKFSEAVRAAVARTAARPDNVEDYISFLMGADIDHFKRKRETGFSFFDKITGGLYPGLYVVAAISSLGKTSWALQLSDQMAAAGEDVLFFSLEMSRLELVSKSIARTAARIHPDKFFTSLTIREGNIPADALDVYKESVGNRLSIVEGNFEVNVSSIGDYIRRYMVKTETQPTVIIDYLQIIQPADDDARKVKREAIDNTVSNLKRLSRELDIPIIVISAVNRANYQTAIDFESLKESGNIEYSADVVLGLQLQCINDPLFQDEKKGPEKRRRIAAAKKENPRKIELVARKNRFGVSSFSCFYDYYPAKDLFVETAPPEDLGQTLDWSTELPAEKTKRRGRKKKDDDTTELDIPY